MDNNQHYVIDWNQIKTMDDLKTVLNAINKISEIEFSENEIEKKGLKDLVKKLED